MTRIGTSAHAYAWIVIAAAALAASAPLSATAASTGSSVVGATVPSATTLDASACAAGMPGITDLGLVPAGTTVVSSLPCAVTFGSSNDTARLDVFQADGWGTALAATDWSARPSGTADILEAITFTSQLDAMAVGINGTIRRTSDGGGTWNDIDHVIGVGDANDDYYRAIEMVDGDTGWIVSEGGEILRTDDGGTTWTFQDDVDAQLNSIAAVNDQVAWIVGNNGTILHTVDGGMNWIPQIGGGASRMHGISAIDASNAWATGRVPNVLLRTTDGGATWSPTASNPGGSNWSIHATSMLEAWMGSSGGHVHTTVDGGANWTTLYSTLATDIRAIERSGSSAWVAGDGGGISGSSDGGVSWVAQPAPTTENLRGIARGPAGQVLAVGYAGTILGNPSSPIADYDEPGGDDWGASGTSVFGVCLDTVADGAVPTWAVHAGCALTDGPGEWNAIPLNAAAPATTIATSPSTDDDARVDLRFGFHAATSQVAGTYVAPLVFQTVAPG